MIRLLVAVTLGTLLVACGGRDGGREPIGETGGTVVVATAAEPNTLFPPLVSGSVGAAVVAQVFDRLAEIGDSLNTVGDAGFRPRLASRWRWAADSLSIAFTIDALARWHDGRPVRASDVRFSFDVYTDPATGSAVAPFLANIDSVSAPDSLTAVFWFKRREPQQFFDATYQMWVLPEHLLAETPRGQLATAPFGRAPIGSGRFRFVDWKPAQRLEIAADENNYRSRALLNRVVWTFAGEFGAATISLINGDADFFEAMRPEYLGQLARNRSLRLVRYPSLEYNFLQLNLRNPVFADVAVRQALTMAVDRARVVQSVYDTLAQVSVGPFPRALVPGWGTLRQLPYNPARARQLLDSAGWTDANADGVRERAGAPLAFTVIVPTSSPARQRMAVLLQEQLRLVGAQVRIEALEFNAFSERLRGRTFDAAMSGWKPDPGTGSVQQTWGSLGARLPNGSNFGSYESPAFDATVDSALATLDPARSRALWLRAYQISIDEAPAIWLFEPLLYAGAHRRLQLAVLRADAWWAHLADWTVPSGERIARDRGGVP